jgi:hypothetical protein
MRSHRPYLPPSGLPYPHKAIRNQRLSCFYQDSPSLRKRGSRDEVGLTKTSFGQIANWIRCLVYNIGHTVLCVPCLPYYHPIWGLYRRLYKKDRTIKNANTSISSCCILLIKTEKPNHGFHKTAIDIFCSKFICSCFM